MLVTAGLKAEKLQCSPLGTSILPPRSYKYALKHKPSRDTQLSASDLGTIRPTGAVPMDSRYNKRVQDGSAVTAGFVALCTITIAEAHMRPGVRTEWWHESCEASLLAVDSFEL